MPLTPAALLCLGLHLSLSTSTQGEVLSRPVIWARPSFLVPKGSPVTLWCWGIREAAEYRLHFEGGLAAQERPKPPGPADKVKFLIPIMTSSTAGRYSCFYRSGELWSEPSDPLDLVVTGMYDTPTLSVQPGPEVALGDSVTFFCHLDMATSTFFLLKEGRPSRTQRSHGRAQAEFPVGPVTAAHQGTYRCFGSYNDHAWSCPSDPVTLLVRDYWDPQLVTTGSGFQKDPTRWDPRAQNLLRIGLASLVLVALAGILVEDWLGRRRAPGTRRAARCKCRRLRTQIPG
uniref:Natural cytotoxicity triggering receptor 1 n=1 Tax=Sciurus vulgaris TaxID=55149 RepID=A0A8D2JPK8_SCIVU